MNAPPGRAGRAWLQHRIELAERAGELLQVKLRRLLEEQRSIEQALHGLDAEWRDCLEEAGRWWVRAALTGGHRAVRLGTPTTLGRTELEWVALMGVRYPEEARYSPPVHDPADGSFDAVPAVLTARRSFERALESGVRHAAAHRAYDILGAEIATVRRRLRALDQRSLPRLRSALHHLELALEEHEHADDTMRRAHHPNTSRRSSTSPSALSRTAD